DGIRYGHVTGVQTCALPISSNVALDGLGCLPEESVGHAFTPRDPIVLAKLNENDLLRGVCGAADGEGHGEVQLHGPDRDIHAGTASRCACASRSAPTGPSRIGSAAGRPVSFAALSIIAWASAELRSAVFNATATTRAGGYPGGRRHDAASSYRRTYSRRVRRGWRSS